MGEYIGWAVETKVGEEEREMSKKLCKPWQDSPGGSCKDSAAYIQYSLSHERSAKLLLSSEMCEAGLIGLLGRLK